MTFTYTVKDPLGVHARPASQLAKLAQSFPETVTVSLGDKKGNAKQVIGLMRLCIKCGDTVTFTVEGENEQASAAALLEFCNQNL